MKLHQNRTSSILFDLDTLNGYETSLEAMTEEALILFQNISMTVTLSASKSVQRWSGARKCREALLAEVWRLKKPLGLLVIVDIVDGSCSLLYSV